MRIILTALAALGLMTASALSAPCISPPMSPEAIADFKAGPSKILQRYASDAPGLENAVRDLAGTDASLAAGLVALAVDARPQQQTAIAAGLAQAALACSTIDQQAGQTIQQAVAAFNDGQFQAAFAAVAGDVATAAISAVAATGSLGSTIVSNPNSGGAAAQQAGTRIRPVTSGVFSVSGPSVTTSSSPSPAVLAAEPVSPTR